MLVYKNIHTTEDSAAQEVKMDSIYGSIRSGKIELEGTEYQFGTRCSMIRKLQSSNASTDEDKKKIKEGTSAGKKTLPVLQSCNSRILSKVTAFSGYLQIDLDHVDDVEKTKKDLFALPFVESAFISPSGTGVKGFARATPQEGGDSVESYVKSLHRSLFKKLEESGFNQDKAIAANPAQACYISYDPDLLVKESCELIEEDDTLEELTLGEEPSMNLSEVSEETISRIKTKVINKEIQKVLCWKDGEKHKKILALGNYLGHLNNGGLTLSDEDRKPLANAITTIVQRDNGKVSEAIETLSKGFENGNGGDRTEDEKSVQKLLPRSKRKVTDPDEGVQLPFKWWTTTETETSTHTSIDFVDLVSWLSTEGWGRYKTHSGEVKLCYLSSGVLDDSDDLFENLGSWILTQVNTKVPEPAKSRVLEAIYDVTRVNPLVTKNHFALWPIQLLPDSRPPVGVIRVFYRDGVVEISNTSEKFIPYKNFAGIVPKSSMLDFEHKGDFSRNHTSVWPTFARCICANPPSDYSDDMWDVYQNYDYDRFQALTWGLGYMLDAHKQTYLSLCFTEANTGDGAEGRAGKGIITKAIKHMYPRHQYTDKNARDVKALDHKNALSNVTANTRAVLFDDLPENFDFKRLFNLITDDWEVGKYGKDSLILPYDRSPKIMLTSNYPIRGVDGSTRARRLDLELTRFFNADYTPRDRFGAKGQMWSFAWDREDWLAFYNFMHSCAKTYLENPTKPPHYYSATLESRRDALEVPDFYRDILDEKLEPMLEKVKDGESIKIANDQMKEWETLASLKYEVTSQKRYTYLSFYVKKQFDVEKSINVPHGGKRGRGFTLIKKSKLTTKETI